MHVGTKAHVVSEIPAGVIGIIVDDDLIGIPEPIGAEGEVGGCDRPVPSIEPEPAGAASGQMSRSG